MATLTSRFSILAKEPPQVTSVVLETRDTLGAPDYTFTSDIYHYEGETVSYLVFSNIPNVTYGQILANSLDGGTSIGNNYDYEPYYGASWTTTSEVQFITDPHGHPREFALQTGKYEYQGSRHLTQYTVICSDTDTFGNPVGIDVYIKDMVGNMKPAEFKYVGIKPPQIAVTSSGLKFYSLDGIRQITSSGTTFYIPYFWSDGQNTGVSWYNYIWGVQGDGSHYYSAFAFDHDDNNRLFAIKQTDGTQADFSDAELQVIEVDYSGITSDLNNARKNDFLTTVKTFQTLTGAYNRLSDRGRIWAANGLIAWEISDDTNNVRTLYVADTTSGAVKQVATTGAGYFGGFDYNTTLGMWVALFGQKLYASQNGSDWFEVQVNDSPSFKRNNFVMVGPKLYYANSGVRMLDLSDIDI